jgi:CubicO group peptidase (beta-lactamase class C family)
MIAQPHVEPGFEPVQRLFAQLFAARGRGGGSFVVRQGDRVLVDLWGGTADPATRRPWQRDSLGLSFSTSKGVSATVIHRLADRGLLSYDEPVAAYWPAFAAAGKGRITVRELLSHRAGLDDISRAAPNVTALLDHVGCEERLAAGAPYRPGAPAYHAISFGWLLAGLARAITGRGMEELVDAEINEPLGIDGLHFGMPRSGSERVPALVGGLGPLSRLGVRALALLPLPGGLPPTRALRSVSTPGFDGVFKGAEPRILQTVMPAVNGMFSAESLATMYAALANGGEVDGRRLLSAETVDALGRVQTRAPDRNLVIPMRWRLGYHQAFVPRTAIPRAFGHYGYAGSGGWADPASGLSAAFVTNRVYAVHQGFGDLALMRLSRLAIAIARNAAMPRPATSRATQPRRAQAG